jgi:DNA polymerase III sliding clamp (beta) subunit (PCNA family)
MSKIGRKELLDCLNIVKPALSSRDFIPIFTYFCFDGDNVIAYDDLIAIRTECAVDIDGAVKGALLLGLLENSGAKAVEFLQKETELHAKAGVSKLKLQMLPREDFIFEMPEATEDDVTFPITSLFVEGIDRCLVSVSTDNSSSEYSGITFAMKGLNVLYSTDDMSISKFVVGSGNSNKEKHSTIIMPAGFCKNLLNLYKNFKKEDCYLVIGEDFVTANFGTKVTLFSKLLYAHKEIDFEKVISQNTSVLGEEDYVSIPRAMPNALKRSCVILQGSSDSNARAVTDFVVEEGALRMLTSGGFGNSRDTFKLKASHDDVEFSTSPNLILRAIDRCDSMSILERCMVLKQGTDYVYLVSARG